LLWGYEGWEEKEGWIVAAMVTNISRQHIFHLQIIADALNCILEKEKLEKSTKTILEGVLRFIREMEEKEKTKAEGTALQPKVSTLHKAIKADISRVYEALLKQLCGILDTVSVTLENSEKSLANMQNLKEVTKDITSKVGKVTDTIDKIATTTQSYRDTLIRSPPLAGNKSSLDPKVLGDMEHKAWQILIELYKEEGNSTLSKSLMEIIVRANETLNKISDAEKPDKVLVESALQTRKGVLVLTLNRKEAANWVRQPEHKIAFTEGFSKGSHIRERSFSLIAPRVLITFDPEDRNQLREVEEVNGLKDYIVRKARWIKLTGRRRLEQTHAYAILTITSADAANLIIRDGLIIHGARVQPTKQKQEPIQCMKCRKWGHFAGECTASKDTCGTCREHHRTNVCTNKGKLWCVTCENTYHASWDRNCLKFNRRCFVMDERNPENSMPYFPTDQDWTQAIRPWRILLEERFPANFAVNSLPTCGNRNPGAGP
jgi:hypothetical protein